MLVWQEVDSVVAASSWFGMLLLDGSACYFELVRFDSVGSRNVPNTSRGVCCKVFSDGDMPVVLSI